MLLSVLGSCVTYTAIHFSHGAGHNWERTRSGGSRGKIQSDKSSKTLKVMVRKLDYSDVMRCQLVFSSEME